MQVQLLKYTDKCFRSLSFSLVSASDVSFESIHHLRLNIKKIRTLLKILEYKLSAKSIDKTIKSINSIFTCSGTLRDNQVQLQILKSLKAQSNNELTGLIIHFKKEQNRMEKLLINSLERLNPFDLVLLNQRIDYFIENQNDKTLKGGLEQKVKEIQVELLKFANQMIEEDSLHQIRILLKEYINLLSMIKKDTLVQIDISKLENLDNIQRKLGEWHDLKLLYDKIFTLNPNAQLLLEIIKIRKDYFYYALINDLRVLKI